ncbi:MAG: M20/M25/M40 family metallo-hydrolase [Candidatus Diapherotrites archaeon]
MSFEESLLSKFVAIDTNSVDKKNYAKFAQVFSREANKLGFKVQRLDTKDNDGRLCPNFLLELNAKPKAKETVLLLAHFDVVPAGEGWKTPPFKLVKKKGVFFGRGVGDDKGAVAAALAAMHELNGRKLKRNVKLLVTCDEEIEAKHGAGFLAKKHLSKLKSDFCLVVDGDFKEITVGCSGVLSASIQLKGKQGHAGTPYRSPNVIHEAIPFLNELLEFKSLREKAVSKMNAPKDAPRKKVWGRFSITILKAGYKSNVIPPSLEIGIDIRTLPEEKAAAVAGQFRRFTLKKMKRFCLKGKVKISWARGYFINQKNRFAKEIQAAAEKITRKKMPLSATLGGIDGRFFSKAGIPAISVGPGGKGGHAPNESITEKELLMTKQLIKALVQE